MTNNAPNTVRRLKELRTNANYGKKKHSNAADRKSKYNYYIGVPVVIITVGLGTAFFLTLSEDFPTFLKWVGGFAGFVSAVLAGLQTHFNFPKLIEGHRVIASRYRALSMRCSNAIAAFEDRILDENGLVDELNKLSKQYEEISSTSDAFSTTRDDYEKARQGIDEGEERYTDTEL